MDYIVGLGGMIVTNETPARIMTFALSSCVGMTVFDPKKQVAGMIHIVLPEPLSSVASAGHPPSYFATLGVPTLFDHIQYRYGCAKEDLMVKLYGGADSGSSSDVFQIGRRNIEAVRTLLTDLGVKLSGMDTGGDQSRTLFMDVETGKISVRYQKMLAPFGQSTL